MYNVITLPYPYYALEPVIDEETVNIHYNGHHKKYNENLNGLVNKYIPLEEIPLRIDEYPIQKRGQILYNAGGVLNHNLYWLSLGDKSLPSGSLLNKINDDYGDFEKFKQTFINKSKNLVGSGYTFLVTDENGDLTIMNLPNQETPITYNLIPLFTIDLWEHAYYLKYRNKRNEYIENIWNKTNFDYASILYEKVIKV